MLMRNTLLLCSQVRRSALATPRGSLLGCSAACLSTTTATLPHRSLLSAEPTPGSSSSSSSTYAGRGLLLGMLAVTGLGMASACGSRGVSASELKKISGKKLSAEEIAELLKTRLADTWELKADGKSIYRKFVFKNFLQAFEWMGKAAVVAEDMDHHPEWFNVYNRVEVSMSTHTCGGVSLKDIEFAAAVNALYDSRQQ